MAVTLSTKGLHRYPTGVAFGGKREVAIFRSDGPPIGKDDGSVPQGSIALDYVTPAIWQKKSNVATDWVEIGNSPSTTNPIGLETISALNPATGLIESVYDDKDILVGLLPK